MSSRTEKSDFKIQHSLSLSSVKVNVLRRREVNFAPIGVQILVNHFLHLGHAAALCRTSSYLENRRVSM